MKLRRKRGDEPEVSLAPLIDVVFLLLIFFMVTTTFVHEQRIDVSLPVAGSGQQVETQERVRVAVDANGAYDVNGQKLGANDSALALALGAAARAAPKVPLLLIEADGRASHQAVVTVMDTAAQVGFERISIATLPRPGSVSP